MASTLHRASTSVAPGRLPRLLQPLVGMEREQPARKKSRVTAAPASAEAIASSSEDDELLPASVTSVMKAVSAGGARLAGAPQCCHLCTVAAAAT
jgi:hypothetical protein